MTIAQIKKNIKHGDYNILQKLLKLSTESAARQKFLRGDKDAVEGMIKIQENRSIFCDLHADEDCSCHDDLKEAINQKADINHTHDWNEITGKPTEFPPTYHSHNVRDIEELDDLLHTVDDLRNLSNQKLDRDGSNATDSLASTIANNHTHSNKAILDTVTASKVNDWDNAASKAHNAVTLGSNATGLTITNQVLQFSNGYQLPTTIKVSEWDDAYLKRHTHGNKTVLDNLTQSVIDQTHVHSNKSVIDGISSADVTNWDAAHANSHTHVNKVILDAITAAYTVAEKNKLATVQSNAQVNVKADWNATSGDSEILNKPSSFTPASHNHAISDIAGLQFELDSKLETLHLNGFVHDVAYNSSLHTLTFYQRNEPNIVIDLPIEHLIKGVQLHGNDLVFTFEDGSNVTIPMNTLLVGVVKSVNGLTANSQGEVVLDINDIPGLQNALDGKANTSGYYSGLHVGYAVDSDWAGGLKGSGGQDAYGGSVLSNGLQYVLGIHNTTGIYKFDTTALNSFLGVNTTWNLQQVTNNGNTTPRDAVFNGVAIGSQIGSYKGFDLDRDFSFLNGSNAGRVLSGGLLASNTYSDASLIPANGIYSKGVLRLNSSIQFTDSSQNNEWSVRQVGYDLSFWNANWSADVFKISTSGTLTTLYHGTSADWNTASLAVQNLPNNYLSLGYVNQGVVGLKSFMTEFSTYTDEGLFNTSNVKSQMRVLTPSGEIRFGYKDYGTGQYFPRIGFTDYTNKWDIGLAWGDFTIGKNNDGNALVSIDGLGTIRTANDGNSTIWNAKLSEGANISLLNNDVGYVTGSVLGNYVLKTGDTMQGALLFPDNIYQYFGNYEWAIGTSNVFNGVNFSHIGHQDGVLFLHDNNNVGIGTTSPNYKLDINGNLHVGTYAKIGNIGLGDQAGLLRMTRQSADMVGFLSDSNGWADVQGAVIYSNGHGNSVEWNQAYLNSQTALNLTWNDVLNNNPITTLLPVFNRNNAQKFVLKTQSTIGNNYFSFQNNTGIETHYLGLGSTTNDNFQFVANGDNYWDFYCNGNLITRQSSTEVQIFRDLYVSSGSMIHTSNHGTSADWFNKLGAGSNISLLNNDAGYITSASLNFFPFNPNSSNVIDANTVNSGVLVGYQWQNVPVSTIATLTTKVYSGDWIRQTFEPIDGNGTIYVRDRHSGTTWGNWIAVANQDWVINNFVQPSHLNNYALSSQIPIDNSQLANGAGYITSASLPNVSNATVTYQGTGAITGGGSHTINQSGNSTYNFDLTNQTKNEISLGVNAYNSLSSKQDALVAGSGISIIGNTISATGFGGGGIVNISTDNSQQPGPTASQVPLIFTSHEAYGKPETQIDDQEYGNLTMKVETGDVVRFYGSLDNVFTDIQPTGSIYHLDIDGLRKHIYNIIFQSSGGTGGTVRFDSGIYTGDQINITVPAGQQITIQSSASIVSPYGNGGGFECQTHANLIWDAKFDAWVLVSYN